MRLILFRNTKNLRKIFATFTNKDFTLVFSVFVAADNASMREESVFVRGLKVVKFKLAEVLFDGSSKKREPALFEKELNGVNAFFRDRDKFIVRNKKRRTLIEVELTGNISNGIG